jgi:hypothetical protein
MYAQTDSATTNIQGTITNGGTIFLASAGFAPSVLNLNSGDVTLTGSGDIILKGFVTGDPFDPNGTRIQGVGGARLTIGAIQTIIGSGQIGSHSTVLSPKLTNHGIITASTFPSGAVPAQGITIFPLVLPMPPIDDAVINDGTMQASDDSFLTFNGGIVTNNGPAGGGMIIAHGHMMPGTVILQAGVSVHLGTILLDGPLSQLQLNDGTALPETLTNTSGGMIMTVAPSVENMIGGAITNSGPGSSIFVKDNSSLEIYGNPLLPITVTNAATIAVGTGAVGVGPATLTVDEGLLTNSAAGVDGSIIVAANGTLHLLGGALGQPTINGGTVLIAQAGGKINLDDATIHNGTLTNVKGGIINSILGTTNTLGGTVNNNAGATISVFGSTLNLETTGTYNNAGTININDAGGAASLCPSGANGTVTLSGGGTVNLTGAGSSIFGVNQNERLTNVDNTITGGGSIGAGKMALTNKMMGIIQTAAAAGPLTIQPNNAGVINGGLIQTLGATLNLTNGTFTNIDAGILGTVRSNNGDTLNLNGVAAANAVIDNGIVQVQPNATLQLSLGTIHNGTLIIFAGGIINSMAGATNTLGGTVNNNAGANINVLAGSTLNLETTGVYNNAGTININAAAGSSLCPSGANDTLTLNGGGTVNLLGAGSSIFGANANETLVNQNNTIAGGGLIGVGKMSLTNRGLIDVTAAMTIQPNNAGVINSGTIQARGGALTLMGGSYTNFEGATNGLIQAVAADTVTLTDDPATGDAIIDGGNVTILAAGTINLSNATIHNGTLTNSAAGTINSTAGATNTLGGTVNNPAGGAIVVAVNSTLKLETGGTYDNAGLISLVGGPVGNSDLQLDGGGGTVTLSGGGTVSLNGSSNISGVVGNERLINLDNTINGTGLIGLNMMSLTNDGTIDSNAAPGITISPNSGGVINGGILQASNGSTLALNGGIYTNTAGIIQALGMGSEVDLQNGATINGGALGNTGAGFIRVVDEAILNTVTNNADIAQKEGSTLDLIGAITNNGTMTIPALHSVTTIKLLSGSVTLGGTGSVIMKNSTLNQIIAANGLDRLTIGASQTVRGTGDIGVGMMALTNNGTIIADQPTSLTIHPNASGFLNTGTLRAAAGSILNVIGGYTQTSGDTNVLGKLNVTGGQLVAGGGTLSGSGTSTISGGFSLTGTFTKQDSGTATISGPQSFNSGTTLNINGGTVKFDVTSGSAMVGTGVTVTIAAGATLELAGSVSALASGSGRVNISNSSAAPGILVSGTNQQVGGIDGTGSTQVNAGKDLTVNHIIQSALVIGGTAMSPATLTIDASDSSGNPLGSALSGPLGQSSGFVLASSLQPTTPFASGSPGSSSSDPPSAEGFSGDPIPAGPFVNGATLNGNPSAVPEPSSALLALLTIGAATMARRWGGRLSPLNR